MGHDGVTGFRKLTGYQQDPRNKGVTDSQIVMHVCGTF